MTYKSILQSVTGKQNGSFRSMMWEKALPVKKSFSNQVVTKRSVGTVRFGIEYDHMKSVQEKRSNGTLPEQNSGLSWGQWKRYPYFIEHKGNTYLRCSVVPNNAIKTEYFLNGIKTTKEVIQNMCLKSAFSNHEKMDVFNVNIDNILYIK